MCKTTTGWDEHGLRRFTVDEDCDNPEFIFSPKNPKNALKSKEGA